METALSRTRRYVPRITTAKLFASKPVSFRGEPASAPPSRNGEEGEYGVPGENASRGLSPSMLSLGKKNWRDEATVGRLRLEELQVELAACAASAHSLSECSNDAALIGIAILITN
jgi:hypothetical protein